MRRQFGPQCDGLEYRLALSTVAAAAADNSVAIIWPTSGSGGSTTGQAAAPDASPDASPVAIIWPTSGSGGSTTGQAAAPDASPVAIIWPTSGSGGSTTGGQ